MRLLLFVFLIVPSFFLSAQSDTSYKKYRTDSGYFFSFDRVRIYYEVRGRGEPVVLIHGFAGNGESWKRTALLNELLTNGFKVITVDLRGNGRSDKPRNEDAYANDAEAKDVMGLVTYLHLDGYDAVGYSRGSIITARLLVVDKRVKKAVMGGMGTGFTDPHWPRRIMFYEALMGKPSKETEGMVNYVKQQGFDTLILAYQQKYQPSTLPAELRKVKQKVLLINGDKDADNGSATDLAKMFTSSTLITVPGDHNSASRTKEFADAVVAFLKE